MFSREDGKASILNKQSYTWLRKKFDETATKIILQTIIAGESCERFQANMLHNLYIDIAKHPENEAMFKTIIYSIIDQGITDFFKRVEAGEIDLTKFLVDLAEG